MPQERHGIGDTLGHIDLDQCIRGAKVWQSEPIDCSLSKFQSNAHSVPAPAAKFLCGRAGVHPIPVLRGKDDDRVCRAR